MTGAADWRGAVGDVWASEWRRSDRSFGGLAPALDAAILTSSPAGPGHALDIGCGAGATSLALAAVRPDLTVTGIDISPELIDAARDRAERAGLSNLRFATADLEGPLPDLPPPDLICSRHGVMFTADPAALFARLRALVRPGAALVFSCFRAAAANPWASELTTAVTGEPPAAPAGYAPGPFAFADPAFVSGVMAAGGWRNIAHQPVDYDYIAGAGADPVGDATGYLSRIGPAATAMRAAPDQAEAMRDRLATALTERRDGDRVAFPAAAWLWSATA